MGELDSTTDNFRGDILNDDDLLAQMLTELQLVLVASWMDLAVRIIFSLGLVMAIADMMELIRYIPMSKNPSGCCRTDRYRSWG